MIDAPPGVVRVTNISKTPWSGGRWRIAPGATIDAPWDMLSSFHGAPALQFDLSGASGLLATHDALGRLTFDFWAPLSSVDGYGRHALDIYRGLVKLGINPLLRDVGWGNDKKPADEDGTARLNASRPPSRIGLTMSVPYDDKLTNHSSVYKLVLTQFETDHVPAYHVAAVNRADHFLTTSSFQVEVWRRCGVRSDIPITVIRPGIDTDFFAYKRPPRDGLFKVLMLGALTGRKGPLEAVDIFREASAGDPSWRFTIKTRLASGTDKLLSGLGIPFKSTKDRQSGEVKPSLPPIFRATSKQDPRISIIVGDEPSEALREYFWTHDAFLWPSKGEGVGLPPLEAMCVGMEVVTANNSGMGDYALPAHCWPIPSSGKERADGPDGFSDGYVRAFGDVGNWWLPDVKKGIKQLRAAHEAWASGQGKGERAAAFVRANHTLELQARSVLKVVEGYV